MATRTKQQDSEIATDGTGMPPLAAGMVRFQNPFPQSATFTTFDDANAPTTWTVAPLGTIDIPEALARAVSHDHHGTRSGVCAFLERVEVTE